MSTKAEDGTGRANEMLVVTHQLAGITFRIESDVRIPYLHSELFERFWVGDIEPDVRYRIRQVGQGVLTLPPLDDEERRWISRCMGFKRRWLEYSIWRSPEVRARLRACLDLPEMVHIDINWNGLYIRNLARNEFDLFYTPEKKGRFLGSDMVASFRNWLSAFLANFSAVMIHGAGVIRRGSAALFLAPDGGGKTAVVKRSNGAPVLNDDHIILRQEDNVIIAHGTPLGRITSGPQQARVGSFFLLEKAAIFEIVPIKSLDVLHFLWNEHLHHWHFLPKGLRLRAFQILDDAFRQAPTYRMRFPQDHVDWDAIDAAMAE